MVENLPQVVRGTLEGLQRSLPAWAFHLHACGPKSAADEVSYS